MINNDIFRRLIYILDIKNAKIVEIFALADSKVTNEQISSWRKRDIEPLFEHCSDPILTSFLDGLIIVRRGRKNPKESLPQNHLTNNVIFRKLKIALDLKAENIIEIMSLANFPMRKSELSSFFRRTNHRNYRLCRDQVLRNFLKGLSIKYATKKN